MQEILDKVRAGLRGAWRFRRYGLAAAWVVCAVGWLFVLAIPNTYESRARVYVNTETMLKPLLQGIAVEPDVDQRLNIVRQALLGRPNLEKVARETDLDLRARTPREQDALITSLAERVAITLEPSATRDSRIPNTFYRITYTDHHREKAIQVVDLLLNSFVEDSLGSNRAGSESAQQFLRQQLKDYEQRLAEAENRLAQFKKANLGLLPGEDGGYFQRLESEMQQARDLESQFTVASSRRRELERQLRGEVPYLPTSPVSIPRAADSPVVAADTQTRIQETQARLDGLLLRFTSRHPDVIATRETLEELKSRRQEELEALKRGDVSAASAANAASNPVYQSIQLAINQVDVELAAIRGNLANRRSNIEQLRKLVNTAPEVEAEHARLTRDYDVTRAQYNTLLERLEQARVSEDAEESGVVRFQIVDPPTASFKPISPNRPLLMMAILVAGLGIGGALPYLLHQLNPVFDSVRSLADITGLPVLGAVSATWLKKQRLRLRQEYLRYSAMSAALLVAFVLAIALNGPGSRLIQQLLD